MFEENNFNNQQSQSTPPATNYTQPQVIPVAPKIPYGYNSEVYQAKKDIRRTAIITGIPLLCLSLIGVVWAYVYLFFTVKIAGMTQAEAIALSENAGMQQILQIILSCFMFLIPFSIAAKCAGFRIDSTIQFGAPKKGTAIPFLLFGIGFCSFANIAVSYSSAIFEGFGIDYNVDFGDNPKGIFGFLLSFIATAIVPALVEEFACRGIVLGLLKKHGEGFAVVASSIVFGIMHGNFEQIPFAVVVGLILGYTYIKTNSIWICIVIHCANNAISVIFNYLANVASVNIQNILYIVYLIITMLAAIFGALLFAKNTDEQYALKKDKGVISEKQKYIWFFTSWAIILFIIFNIIEALSFFVI